MAKSVFWLMNQRTPTSSHTVVEYRDKAFGSILTLFCGCSMFDSDWRCTVATRVCYCFSSYPPDAEILLYNVPWPIFSTLLPIKQHEPLKIFLHVMFKQH